MKSVLFISITEYDLNKPDTHLGKKFSGISKGFNVCTIARGKPFYKNIWHSNFYLLPRRSVYLLFAFLLGVYLCLTKNINTIICQGPLTEGFIGIFLKFLFKKELIIEIHGDWKEGPFLNKKRLFAPILKKLVPHLGAWTLKRADKIRTLTRIASDEIKSQYPGKKYFVFPTFTDIDIFLEEKYTSFNKYILTVAVLSPIKSIETLIEAFADIHKKFPEYKLVIAGDGPVLENLKIKVKNVSRREIPRRGKKLNDSIIFTGQLSLIKVKNIMKDCYTFALPSLSEGFGRVFMEAMALGKPVIATRVGGIPEIVHDGENGFLVEPKDSIALAGKIEVLIKDESLARKMGEEGKKFVRENFSNAKYIEKYIEMVNS